MSRPLSLLVEASDQIEVLTEQTENGKQLYIEGIFCQSNVVNGNGRIYEKQVMEGAIDKYIKEYVSRNRALGELNHPTDRPFADPEHAAIRIVEMNWQGNDVHGKAIVLNTPKGQIVKGLLEGGFNLGVSTRALGSLKERNGVKYVQDDLMFTAVDAVDNPSGPDCYVNPLTESVQWAVNESGIWQPIVNKEESNLVNSELFLEKLEQFIKGLK